MKTNKKTIITAIATLSIGLLLGWIIFGGSGSAGEDEPQHDTEISGETTWTCSMHPQIRQNEPGDCPICGMDLIPLEDEQGGEIDPMAISMSATAMQLANISTALVGSGDPVKSVRLNGKVQSDERMVFSQSTHIPGRIEQLMVNFTGELVQQGQVIASVYSPELVTAQEELFEAQKISASQPRLFQAAKEKLRNWKLTDNQIEQILQSGTRRENFNIRADVSGYITEKMVNNGDYITRGESIYEIADLSRVWVLFDVYESDIQWINEGDLVRFTVASLPGESFEGSISYLDPVIDPRTRVASARVEYNNSGLKLKPEMFATGTVEAKLPDQARSIVVPKTAVMWTGERSLVYVKAQTEQGVNFKAREVTLGPALGDGFIVSSGLSEGEEIAVNGTFSIDAAAQLAGKPSMMNPEGGPSMTGHDHGAITGSGSAQSDEQGVMEMEIDTDDISPQFQQQLTDVYSAYLEMKDAFVASDAQNVGSTGNEVARTIGDVDMGLLEGDAHMLWMDQLNELESSLSTITGSSDIEEQRTAFINFNTALYEAVKAFGLHETTAYYQFCPMADNDNGAYWLSDSEEIRNPYFGDMMMTCGEIVETLK